MNYGYIRVSAKDQNEARQISSLKNCNIPIKNLYCDKQSGKDFNRPAYKKLLKKLRPGDILFIHSIDRLGRNYDEILEQWRIITKYKLADIVVLDFPLLDTREKIKGQDLTGRFISDLVLQILAYVAQKERENIRKRQAEGIAAAKARGVKFGPKRIQPTPKFYEAQKAFEAGIMTVQQASELAEMKKTTFFRLCYKLKEENNI